MEENSKKSPIAVIKKIFSIVSTVILVAVFVLLCVVFLARIFGDPSDGVMGFHVNVIATGSMEPEIKVGDIIISRSYHGQKLFRGDVITYVSPQGEMKGKLITHEIYDIDDSGDELVIITKGIASDKPDAPIGEEDIVSVMLYNTKLIKYIYKIITTPVGFAIFILLPLVASIVTEAVVLIKQAKKKKNE